MPATGPSPVDSSILAEALRVPLVRLSRRLRQEAQKSELTAQDISILASIRKVPGLGVSELAVAEQISRPTMSSHVKRLETAGWVTRADHADDGRRSGLTVTPEGLQVLELIRNQRNDWLSLRLARLTPEERDQLAAAIEPLIKLTRIDP